MSATLPLPDLLDPATYHDGPPRDQLRALARKRYVRTWSDREQIPFWAVGGHKEVSTLMRDWRRLSSHADGTILHAGRGASVPDSLTSLDPPRHSVLRRVVSRLFKPAEMQRIEATVREAARRSLAALADEGSGDFVAAARAVPAQVIGELLGVLPADRDEISYLGHLVNFVEDPSYADVIARAQPVARLTACAHDLAARERLQPTDGIVADLLNAGTDEHPITVREFESLIVLLVAAGNGTTIDTLVSAVRLLSQHPAACAQLRQPGAEVWRTAVEEVLRWATPINYFARTATEPIDMGGDVIEAGDRVAFYFAAANFDERVFPGPFDFDIGRSPNPHLAFGQGPHTCVGAPLARLEVRVVLEELCRHYDIVDVEQEPLRIVSHINNGYAGIRVRLRRVPA